MTEPTMDYFDTPGAAPQPTQPDTPNDGVIRLGGKTAPPVPDVPLFAIDGDTYSVPAKIRPNTALQIMAKFESEGPIAAQVFMFRTLLGPAGFNALMSYDALESDDLQAITDRLMEMTFAAAEATSGK